MKIRYMLIMATACFLAACADPAAPVEPTGGIAKPSSLPSAGPNPQGPQWDESFSPVEGAILSASPNPANFCQEKIQAVEVHWDMQSANPSRLQIWVEDGQGKRQLWTTAPNFVDTKLTGKWIQAGTRIIALDPKRNVVLNSITIAAVPCNG